MGRQLKNDPYIPSFVEEERFIAAGYQLIAGVDEVGRGALAGPVLAAAVILPCDLETPWLSQVRDSKQLTPTKRESLFHLIKKASISIGIGTIEHKEIDAEGIVKATRLAMRSAIGQLSPPPEAVLIDYMLLPDIPLPQRAIKNGDGVCLSIACASIIAKVTRDQIMIKLDKLYSGYGLAQHKGYGTKEHFSCLRRLGPCPIHRQSFSPISDIMKEILH